MGRNSHDPSRVGEALVGVNDISLRKKYLAKWRSNETVNAVLDGVQELGKKIYFVGGCVRNELLGKNVEETDMDFATTAEPDEVIALAEVKGWDVQTPGKLFGTVMVIVDGTPFDVTTFRKDLKTFGRHADVEYSEDIVEDAKRRDFTMNALYVDQNGILIDPLNGRHDLRDGIVRFIGNADERIREDYLRMLRYFRMHAHYSKDKETFDDAALEAIKSCAQYVVVLTKERIGREIRRLLEADDPSRCLIKMEEVGLLQELLPGSSTDAVGQLGKIQSKLGKKASPSAWLALMRTRDAAEELRLSRPEEKRIKQISEHSASTETAAALASRLGEDPAIDIVLTRAAIRNEIPESEVLKTAKRAASANFPIKAQDLMPDFVGPELGAELERLRSRWVESDFRMERSELLGIVGKPEVHTD